MDKATWFDVPVIGNLTPKEIATILLEIEELGNEGEADIAPWGERKDAKALETKSLKKWWEDIHNKPWMHTNHVFGYIKPARPGNAPLSILPPDAIPVTHSLKNARVRITLNRLRVEEYPGRGTHQILVHFYAQNQTPDTTEELHFNTLYRVRQKQHAAIQGYPIFVGLHTGSEGLTFKCRTINVKNDQDERFLEVLESDVFRGGLRVISLAQPAIVPLSEMAYGLAKSIAVHHRNVSVQDFDLGLDFSTIAGRMRLAEGAYIAVQVPKPEGWTWDEWVYHADSGQIVQRTNPQQPLPYNYLIFGVSRYESA
jgi:hypothetical protein